MNSAKAHAARVAKFRAGVRELHDAADVLLAKVEKFAAGHIRLAGDPRLGPVHKEACELVWALDLFITAVEDDCRAEDREAS